MIALWLRPPTPTVKALVWIPGEAELIVFSQQNWRVKTMGSEITRLCDGDVSWLLQNDRDWGCANSGTGMLAYCWGWVVNLLYCLCGDLLEVGSLAKGSWMLGWSGQLSDGQETSMGWEQDGLGWGAVLPRVSAQSTWWMDTAECRGVVEQRKLFSVVTRKRNMSKVSPGLGWYQHGKSGIYHTKVNDSMVVRTCRLLTAKSRSARRGASHHSAFIVSCLTVSQMRLPCQPSWWIRLQS